MENKQKFVLIEEVAALLDVSVKFLKRCITALCMDFKIENDEILLDMTLVDNYIGIKETAKILSMSPRSVRRYTKSENNKKLKSYKFKKDFVYQLSDIEDFINKSVYKIKQKGVVDVETQWLFAG